MRFFRPIVRLLAVLGTVLLVSCIDGREEYWLNSDGSGRVDVTYSLPAAAARFQGGEAGVRKMLEAFLIRNPAIKSPTLEVTTDDGRLTIHLLASFESAMELKEISKGDPMSKLPASATGLTGVITLTVAGRTVDFTRRIDAARSLPGSSFMPASQFEGRHLTYIAHLPVAATESNASQTTDQGRTLTWDYPLDLALKAPVTMRFKAPVPLPLWLLASAGSAALAVGLLLVAAIRRRRRPAIG